jgi:hypothetical protein
VPAGGGFVADGYHFEANQGLSVTGAVPAEVYTVDLVFSYDAYSGWHKVLDFKDLATDEGYYTYEDRIRSSSSSPARPSPTARPASSPTRSTR